MWVNVLKEYIAPALSATSTAGALFMWLMRRSFAGREQVEHLNARLLTVETRLGTTPSAQTVHALKVEITELRGDLKETRASLQAVTHQLELLVEKALYRSDG
ncbi:MAG: DUF2730 family protein [Candidatus Symbiopectobacterium sp. Dall1.0]|nr:DUF2730 family protein [Candidatus Symbiopectobacterium sp. Dall1.0]OZI15540.1 hypothetical protein CE195_00795 [Sodalis-like symbiont of Philaenus spumarius]